MDASQLWYPEILLSGLKHEFFFFYLPRVCEMLRNTSKHHFGSNGLEWMLHNFGTPKYCFPIDFNDTMVFNNIISPLGLIELPLKGRSYTWSNMQEIPLLQQIDWFFTSVAWTTQFPLSLVLPLAKITSDHLPCKVQIGTNIPKANIFRFENY
jgi:hypothetical protein